MFPKGCEISWLYECFHSPIPPSVELKNDILPSKIWTSKIWTSRVWIRTWWKRTHQLWVDETLAQDEVRVWEICQCFQKDADNILSLETRWIELVQFQNSQIRFQIICVFSYLSINVLLQCWQVLRIVPEESIFTFTSRHHNSTFQCHGAFRPLQTSCPRSTTWFLVVVLGGGFWWKLSCWESRNVDQILRCRCFGRNDPRRKMSL